MWRIHHDKQLGTSPPWQTCGELFILTNWAATPPRQQLRASPHWQIKKQCGESTLSTDRGESTLTNQQQHGESTLTNSVSSPSQTERRVHPDKQLMASPPCQTVNGKSTLTNQQAVWRVHPDIKCKHYVHPDKQSGEPYFVNKHQRCFPPAWYNTISHWIWIFYAPRIV